MKMKRIVISLSLIAFCVPTLAVVFGGSNLGLSIYPSHSCIKPSPRPEKPNEFYSQDELNDYNTRVEKWNIDVERYSVCIDKYLQNTDNDIDRIMEKKKEAVAEFNAVVTGKPDAV
jgi:hypothetical protein